MNEAYSPTDRRPIAARDLKIMHRIAAWLAATSVTANQISIFGMVAAVLAGVLLACTSTEGSGNWLLWVSAAVLIEARLLANLFDGMVAISQGKASPLGELFNEAPDRVSDAAVLIGLGYADFSVPSLGFAAALFAVLTAYVRALGKAAGARQHYSGSMAKQTRMQIIVGMSLVCGLLAYNGAGPVIADSIRLPVVTLVVIIIGCIHTVFHRFQLIAADLTNPAA